MSVRPQAVKVQCPQCQATDIFMPKSDVIWGFPKCKKCGIVMRVVGQASVVDRVKSPKSWF